VKEWDFEGEEQEEHFKKDWCLMERKRFNG
jgi:hypothetical protein